MNFGLTKNFSIGGGLELISTFVGRPILFLTPKVGFQLEDKVYAGAGVFVVIPTSGGGGDGFTLPFGVVTIGSTESNMSISFGLLFNEGAADRGSLLSISGFHRLSTSFALLTENYFVTFSDADTPYFGIQGLRIVGRKNSFDFGVILGADTPFPYVGYVRNF